MRSPGSSARTRWPISPWTPSTRRSGPRVRRTATPASPATTRSATPRRRTASSPSRTSPSSPRAGSDLPAVSDFRIAVLASGTGTNLQAILDQLHGEDGIAVAAVASDKPDAMALERASKAGVETRTFPSADYEDRVARDAAIGDWLVERGVDLIVLAGYMQLLSEPFVMRFRNRIVNVHPALLPSFPGLDAIGQALEHGVQITGVTVHFVDEGV